MLQILNIISIVEESYRLDLQKEINKKILLLVVSNIFLTYCFIS